MGLVERLRYNEENAQQAFEHIYSNTHICRSKEREYQLCCRSSFAESVQKSVLSIITVQITFLASTTTNSKTSVPR